MFKKIKITSPIYRWLVSYLVMFFLMLLASVGLFFYSYDIIGNPKDEVFVIRDGVVKASNEKLKEKFLEEYTIQELLENKLNEVVIDDKLYYLERVSTEATDVQYITLTSQENIYIQASRIQYFMVLVMLVCLSSGLAVMYYLIKKKYNPLKDLLEALGYYDETDDLEEYEWLLKQRQLFREKHQRARTEINQREKIVRQQNLYRLISLPYDSRYQKKEDLVKEEIFSKENIFVFLFFLKAVGHESIYANMNRNMIRFILKDILEEMLEGRLSIEVVDMMDHFACIVNTEKSQEEYREILEETLDEMKHYLFENMEVQVHYVFGPEKKGMDGVNTSYILAREAAAYMNVMPEAQYIWYDDIKTRHSIYHYPADIEQKIINAVCVGNNESVCHWIDEVIDMNYKEREITQHMKKCLVADMCGTLIKAGEQAGAAEFIVGYMDNNPISDEWTGHWDVKILRAYMHQMLNALCEEVKKGEVVKRDDKKFGLQVMEYVKENYRDPDLNISIAALHFGITPSYLSALFKEQTGLNLLEYINHIRVERVKQLLEENYSLTEICDQTGFRSSGGLIRVFKKETGVTPGQMKKILGQHTKE